jgi:hypothetical protein
MKRFLLIVAVGLLLACSLLSAAQDKGAWRAASSTASSITGDIVISNAKLSISFVSFPLAEIRSLEPSEIVAAFDAETPAGSGNLYRLNISATRQFLHHNTLCGSDDTQWMATYVSGRELHVAFFSGANMPVLTPEALAKTTDLCGTFLYSR